MKIGQDIIIMRIRSSEYYYFNCSIIVVKLVEVVEALILRYELQQHNYSYGTVKFKLDNQCYPYI